MKFELAVVGLWLIAVVPTFLLVHESGLFTFLGPLYFMCMVGSVFVVRSAKNKDR